MVVEEVLPIGPVVEETFPIGPTFIQGGLPLGPPVIQGGLPLGPAGVDTFPGDARQTPEEETVLADERGEAYFHNDHLMVDFSFLLFNSLIFAGTLSGLVAPSK